MGILQRIADNLPCSNSRVLPYSESKRSEDSAASVTANSSDDKPISVSSSSSTATATSSNAFLTGRTIFWPWSSSSKPTFRGLAFLKRRVRLRRNSAFYIPLWLLLLIPCIIVFYFSASLSGRRPISISSKLLAPAGPPKIRKLNTTYDKPFATGCQEIDNTTPRANAVITVLARNQEIDGVVKSMRSFERHFNRFFNYPYVFLNDVEFDDKFKETVRKYTNSFIEFGTIDPSMWGFPDWMSKDVAREGIREQDDRGIMYGGMESYHHMCRFYSGFFYKHPLLLKYEWFWRLEPDIKFYCDITYDPFLKMIEHNKTYGFNIVIKEIRQTVPNLFRYASAYKRTNNFGSRGLWEMFVDKEGQSSSSSPNNKDQLPIETRASPRAKFNPSNMEGEDYNLCHFWSNFEIAKFSFFRSKEYENFFQTLDRSGGFWIERWGDAPVHTLAAGILLSPRDIHYFRDIGYRHTTIQHCPGNAPARQLPRIPYLENTIPNEKKRREEDEYWDTPDPPMQNGVGCRCRCETDIKDTEEKHPSCFDDWVRVTGGYVSPV